MKSFVKSVMMLTLMLLSLSIVYAADIVINEVGEPYTMPNTYYDSYVELYNNSDAAVDVGGWVVWSVEVTTRATYSFEFPTGTSIAVGGYLIATRDRTKFLADYGTYVAEAIVPVAATTSGSVYIKNGYYFELVDGSGTQVDITSSTVGWDKSVFEKSAPGDDGTVADNWHVTSQTSPVEGTPGQANSPAPVATAYTIAQIQDTTGTGSEASPHDGEYIETFGVITATSSSSTYWLQDGTGEWSGIVVYAGYGFSDTIGDSVTIVGTVDEFSGLTEVTNVVSTTLHASGVDLPTATVVTTAEAGTEAYESVLVSTSGICVNDSIGYGEWELYDGSDTLVVDDMFYDVLPTVGYHYDITGVMTYASGAFKIEPRDSADVVTTVVGIDELDVAMPSQFALHNNYPNPFNPTTQIEFAVPIGAELTLNIYNILGQMVASIHNGYAKPGTYTLTWNGRDMNEQPVPSGVYLYELNAGAYFHAVKKMTLLK